MSIKTLTSNIENKLKQTGSWVDLMTRFDCCTNDFERMKIVIGSAELVSQINAEIRGYKRTTKSVEAANTLRAAGNELFKSAQYRKAFDCYSQAVCHAPFPAQDDYGSCVLALSFGNRSAALFHLKQFDHCLTDIDHALQAGVPASSLHKLLDRKGKCLLFLKRKQLAVEAFEEAKLALLADHSLDAKARQDLQFLTESFIAKCKSLEDEKPASKSSNFLHEPVPTLLETSTQVLCASNVIMIRDEQNRGRGLYAARDIAVGELLIVEKPYISVVISNYAQTHCHECCARCFVPLPCEHCVDVVFCSTQCQQSSLQNSHDAECGLLSLFHQADVRLGHLAYRMVAKAGYRQLKELRQALEHPCQMGTIAGCDDRGVYKYENYCTVYNLVGHSDKRTFTDLWPRAVKAAFLVQCLQQSSFFPPLEDNDDLSRKQRHEEVCYIASHILRHLMMLPCNAHEVSEMAVNWQEPSQSETLEIGSGIYTGLSLINHSCDPSVVRHSYDNVCIVRAIRSIEEGEELFDNYGALYPVMDKALRQEHLEKQYFFTCACEACTNNWPIYVDIPKDVMHFNCEKCRGRVPVPGIRQADKAENMACMDCSHHQNIRSLILKVGGLEESFQDALHKVIFKLDVEGDTLSHLLQFLHVVDKHVHRPFSFHNDCQEAVKMCFAYKANASPRHS